MSKRIPGTRRGFTLVEILIVVCIIGILLSIATPVFINAREGAKAKACQSNLKEVLGAKERWAMDNNKGPGDTPGDADLAPYYVRTIPVCPSSGTYTAGMLKDIPTCSVGGVRGELVAHVMP